MEPNIFTAMFTILICAIAYMAPTVIAIKLQRINAVPILICNIVIGWTIFTWIIILIWALLGKKHHC